MDIERVTDIEHLRRIALAQHRELQRLTKVLASKSAKIDELLGKSGELQATLKLIDQMQERERRAAKESEEFSKNEREPGTNRNPDKTKTGHGPTQQTEIERVVEVSELDDADRACPACGGTLEPLDGQFETSEVVDVIDVRYRVVEARRQKYVCQCGGCVETAPGPERLINGGRYSLRFGAKVAIDKYLDHAPLARQARTAKRHGLSVTTQALWDQLWAMASQLRPSYDALLAHLLGKPVIGLDQTSWKRLEERNGRPWQMWCLTADDVVFHTIRDDKSARTFVDLVGHYNGVIICDALSTHGAGAREGPGIVLAGCWAHVFRKYQDALEDHPQAEVALALIKNLYEIDARAQSLEERLRLRQVESVAVLRDLKTWCEAEAILKSTSVGDAIRYTLTYWSRLTRFIEDARIPLDNNATERGVRGPVVGRKNHYGSKSQRGTEVASIFYTLLETAKLNDVSPSEYLVAALRAAKQGRTLLPLPGVDLS